MDYGTDVLVKGSFDLLPKFALMGDAVCSGLDFVSRIIKASND